MVTFDFTDKSAVRNNLHSLAKCQFQNGLSFVKDKKPFKSPPLSGGSQFHEIIGAVEYRNEIFLLEY